MSTKKAARSRRFGSSTGDRELERNGPTATSARAPWRIAILSFLVLVLELALIRQVPAEVRAISYFTNLLLMASFFGLGLGCILQDWKSLQWLLPAGILLLFVLIWLGRGIVVFEQASAVHYWLDYEELEHAPQLPLFPCAVAAFLATALPFVALGQALARAMDVHPRLVAYSWDIAGSLIGTVGFVLAASLSVPPWIWIPIVTVLWAAFFLESWEQRAAHALPGLLFLAFAHAGQDWLWSPYYFVQTRTDREGLRVWVNSNFHQLALEFGSSEERYAEMAKEMKEKFGVPYQAYRRHNQGRDPKRVLILGAGTGNDAYIALQNGAAEVVAVEIDPAIIRLGRERSPMKPYDDPRVRLVEDDARHFLWNCDESFDLVLLGTLDSLTLLTGYANLRLENYVYTRESFGDARALLNPGGIVAAYYSVFRPWIVPRLYSTVRSVFGERTRMIHLKSPFLFNTIIMGSADLPTFGDDPQTAARYASGLPSTDDWPYMYLERPTIAPVYLKVSGAIVLMIVGVFLLLRRAHRGTGLHGNFFLLGLGFALVESAAIVRLMLLFGSTWIVTAVVFSGVLLTIFLANLLVLVKRALPLHVAWAGLLAAVAANYFFPIHVLFGVDLLQRTVAAALLIGLPVFFAATCFSRLFEREPTTGYPLGINLLGVMGGGLLEYLSMLWGMRAVWLIVLAVYALAWFATLRSDRRRAAVALTAGSTVTARR